MLIDSGIFEKYAYNNPLTFSRNKSLTFEKLLAEDKQNQEEVLNPGQNPWGVNNLNMGTGQLGYLMGISNYPNRRYASQYDMFQEFGTPSSPNSATEWKNAFALWAGAPTS